MVKMKIRESQAQPVMEKPLKMEADQRRKPFHADLPKQNMNMLKTLRGVRK